MFRGSNNPKYDTQNVPRIVFTHQNGQLDATLWNVVAITPTQNKDLCLLSTVVFLCVVTNVIT